MKAPITANLGAFYFGDISLWLEDVGVSGNDWEDINDPWLEFVSKMHHHGNLDYSAGAENWFEEPFILTMGRLQGICAPCSDINDEGLKVETGFILITENPPLRNEENVKKFEGGSLTVTANCAILDCDVIEYF